MELGNEKIDRMREVAEKHDLSLLQLACLWNLAHPAVESVIPTLIQEAGDDARTIEAKLDDLESELRQITDNTEKLRRGHSELVELQIVLEKAGGFFEPGARSGSVTMSDGIGMLGGASGGSLAQDEETGAGSQLEVAHALPSDSRRTLRLNVRRFRPSP